MSNGRLVAFTVSVFFLSSHCATASSIDVSSNSLNDILTSSNLNPSSNGSGKIGTAQTLSSNLAASDPSSLQFDSAIVESVAAGPRLTGASTAGISVGGSTAFFVGRGAIAPRCIVEAPDPAPSVTPEPASALLFGLGLAALSCIGRWRGWTLGNRV